jgi:hypothetical protein
MCGHGTIGLVATLSFMKRIDPGEHRIETPVGTVSAVLHSTGEVTVNNVASYRLAANVEVDVPRYGNLHGDVAWGGNWFFLVRDHNMELSLTNIEELTNLTWAIRQALRQQGIRKSTTLSYSGRPICLLSTARISFSVPGRPTIVLPAAPGPAPSWPASMPMEKFVKARCGNRRALSEAYSKAVLRCGKERSIPASKALPS